MVFPGVETGISCQFTASDGITAAVAGTTKAFQPSQTELTKEYGTYMPADTPYANFSEGFTGFETADRETGINPYNLLGGDQTIPCAVAVDPDTGESDAMLPPDSRLSAGTECRLPETAGEIAITDFHADMFMRFSHVDNNADENGNSPGTEYGIEKPDDLTGLKIEDLTIVGIYETEEDTDELKAQYDFSYEDIDRVMEKPESGAYRDNCEHCFEKDVRYWLAGTHVMTCAFVNEAYFSEGDPDYATGTVLYRLSGSKSGDKKLSRALEDTVSEETEDEGTDIVITYSSSVSMETCYSGFREAANYFYGIEEIRLLMYAFSGIFGVISILLLINLFTTDLEDREKEIGILRGQGAGRAAVMKIAFTEGLATALIILVAALVFTEAACIAFNVIYGFWQYGIRLLSFLLLAAMCVAVTTLATLLPVSVTMRRSPADIVRNA